ncbi:MAG: hypothetical protein ACJAT2_000889 [Bacteriovoracaceae bacterium]|jgi:hypothetical protein
MKNYLFLTLSFLILNTANAQIRIIDDCNPPITNSSTFDRLAQDIADIEEKTDVCSTVPAEDRKIKGAPDPTFKQAFGGALLGCGIGLLKGLISGLKDMVLDFWDLGKLGWKLAKKFGKKMVNYLHLAYKSGITTLFSEYARDSKDFLETIMKGLGAIPEMIYNLGQKGIENFKCLNIEAKSNYICTGIGYLGTEVVLNILTGGAKNVAVLARVQKAAQFATATQKARLVAKVLPKAKRLSAVTRSKRLGRVVEGLEAQKYLRRSLRSFDPVKAKKTINFLDKRTIELKRKLDKLTDSERKLTKRLASQTDPVKRAQIQAELLRKQKELRSVTKNLTLTSTNLSHLRSKEIIYNLDKQGLIEVRSVISDGKIPNRDALAKGRYPPWSEGGPVYEVKVKKGVQLCRGGKAGEALQQAGRWFLPCSTDSYRSKADNQWVTATADNPFDEFTKYNLKEGDVIQIGGINPILSETGGSLTFVDKASQRRSVVRGGGGEVQFFRPAEGPLKLGPQDVVRSVKVYNDKEIRTLQAQLARVANKEEVLKIRERIKRRVNDTEASSFLLEIEDKLSGMTDAVLGQ